MIKAYITDQNFDIVCLSETFLNLPIQNDDHKLKIDGFNLIRSDHTSESKKKVASVFIIKNIFLLLVTEIRSQSEKCFLICAYHSHSQSQEEFKIFCLKSDTILSQINDEFPLSSMVNGDFNAVCTNWWKDDITNSAGREIASLTSSAGYTQIIDKPTHVINNSVSFIDLIFCSNQNLMSKYGVDASIFDKCHHNIIYGKIGIPLLLTPLTKICL